MNGTHHLVEGQSNAVVTDDVLLQSSLLIQYMLHARAWYERFIPVLKEIEPTAARTGHASFIEGAAAARALARELRLECPDYSAYEWSPAPPPARDIDPFGD